MHTNTFFTQNQPPRKYSKNTFNFYKSFHFEEVPSYIKKDPEKFFQNLPIAFQKCLDILFWYTFKCHTIFVSQNTLATMMGNSLTHCQRVLKKLKELGLISSIRRTYETCIYKIADYFFNPTIIKRLSFIFPSLKALSLGLVLLNEKKRREEEKQLNIVQSEYVVSINIRYKNIYKNHSTKNIKDQKKSIGNFSHKNIKEILLEEVGYQQIGRGISTEVENFGKVEINESGKIKLSVFSPIVLRKVKEKLKKRWWVRNLFGWIYKQCIKYSLKLGLWPQWEIGKQLEDIYKNGEEPIAYFKEPWEDRTWYGSHPTKSGPVWSGKPTKASGSVPISPVRADQMDKYPTKGTHQNAYKSKNIITHNGHYVRSNPQKLPQNRVFQSSKFEVTKSLEERRSHFAAIAKMLSYKKTNACLSYIKRYGEG